MPYNSFLRLLDLPFDYFVKKNVTNFITASRFAGDSLSEVLKIKRELVLHIYNTFQKRPIVRERQEIREKLNVAENQILVGSAGLLQKRKGHNYLIEAAHLLKSELNCSGFRLIILGDGPEKENLERLINEHNLGELVSIIPSQDNIFDYYNSFDIFALASIDYDDLPFTVREAMSMGLPIVSTRFAGIPEIVEDNKNGFLVEKKNSLELARSLKKLIETQH